MAWNAAIILSLCVAIGATAVVPDSDAISALYIARVVSVSPAARDAYVDCLRTTELPDRRALPSVQFIVEYIAVQNSPDALAEDRETMRTSIGPAAGQLVRDGYLHELRALETASVEYAQAGMPRWNQIHVRGFFPDKGPTPAAMDEAMKQVNPQRGGFAQVFGRLDAIRSKPREDVARQLYELDLR